MKSRLRYLIALLGVVVVAALGASAAQADQVVMSGPVYSPAPPVYVVAPPKEKSTPTTVVPPSRPRIVTRPRRRTRKHLARFVFLGGNRFECELDHGPYRPCGAVFTRFVSTGRHVLRVRVAGGGPVASFRWHVLPRR